MKIKKSFLTIIASALVLGSCTDFDNGFDARQATFEKEFIDAFGNIDPNQDWSMATQVKANVSGVQDGMLEIFYSDPIGGQPIVIAKRQIEGGTASLKFDVVKGTKQVFARINDGNGYYSLKSNFQINNGEVEISPKTTRAAIPTGESRVTKSAAQTITTNQAVKWEGTELQIKLLPQAESSFYIDGQYGIEDAIGNKSTLYMDGPSGYFTSADFTNVYMLYNVINPDDERPEWYVKDIAPFFTPIDGHDAVFEEGVNHVKFMKNGSNPKLEKDLIFEMESDGPFYLDYFAKGTAFDNQLGYFYYTGNKPTAEEFKTMPKFILVDNISGTSKAGVGNKVTTIASGTTKDWDLLKIKYPASSIVDGKVEPSYGTINDLGEHPYVESNWDTKVVGTRLQLTYFGEDGKDEKGSYTFPANTKIGLFILGNGDHRQNEFITSIAELNLKLFNEYPHAASFKYNDQIVFAMEDQHHAGDADVNDVMFIANGTFKKTDIPDIEPVVPTSPTWIVACEDLGGTYDYDFNDLVFGLRKTDKGDGTSTLHLVPLAAGGTLDAKIYYDGSTTPVGEIHNLVSPGAPVTNPINVASGSTPSAGTEVLLADNIDSDESINNLAATIKVVVTKKDASSTDVTGTYNLGFKKGNEFTAPQMLLLNPGWDWPSEGTYILDVYPSFKDWVGNAQTTWYTKATGATDFVTNPVPDVVTPSTPSGGESGGGSGSSSNPLLDGWDITVSGNATMEKGSTQTLTITIDGVSDYSNLTFGTYSTTVITATAVQGEPNKIQITSVAPGTALLWVKMAGDDTHKLTRKDYEITVTNPMPVFSVTYNGKVIQQDETIDLTWNGGYDFRNITFDLTKGTSYRMQVTSSNTSVAEAATEGFNLKGVGETTITFKHQSGSDGTTVWGEKVLSFKLNVKAQGSDSGEGGGSGSGDGGGGSGSGDETTYGGNTNVVGQTKTITCTLAKNSSPMYYEADFGDFGTGTTHVTATVTMPSGFYVNGFCTDTEGSNSQTGGGDSATTLNWDFMSKVFTSGKMYIYTYNNGGITEPTMTITFTEVSK